MDRCLYVWRLQCGSTSSRAFFAAPRLKSTEAVEQTQNEIFNASVNYSAFSLQFCLIWSEEDQDPDDSANVHVCVSVGNLMYFHIFSTQYFFSQQQLESLVFTLTK